MKKAILFCALGLIALAGTAARADEFSFSFTGPDVSRTSQFSFSGSGTLYATYSGIGNVWDINSISGTVTTDTYTGSRTAPSTSTYDIGNLLPTDTFQDNDNILYFPPGLSVSGADYFDTDGVSFSLVGSTDVNLDTGIVIVFPYDQGIDGNQSESVTETVCWEGPGDPPAPTPEPGSLALLGTSILGGAGLLRRRFKA